MIWSKPRFQHAFELLPRVLKEVAPWLLPISFILWGQEFYVSWLNKARFDDPYSSSMTIIVVAGVTGLIFQSLATVFGLLLVARSTQRQMKNGHGQRPWPFVKKHFHQSLIEYLRSMISIGLYSLLLVIPGVIRWVQLTFVTLVTAFDSKYQNGKVDALKESSRLVGGAWLPLLFLLLTQMALPFLLQEMALGSSQPNQSFLAIGFNALPFYLAAWLLQLYFSIYMSLTFFARHSFKMERA